MAILLKLMVEIPELTKKIIQWGFFILLGRIAYKILCNIIIECSPKFNIEKNFEIITCSKNIKDFTGYSWSIISIGVSSLLTDITFVEKMEKGIEKKSKIVFNNFIKGIQYSSHLYFISNSIVNESTIQWRIYGFRYFIHSC